MCILSSTRRRAHTHTYVLSPGQRVTCVGRNRVFRFGENPVFLSNYTYVFTLVNVQSVPA